MRKGRKKTNGFEALSRLARALCGESRVCTAKPFLFFFLSHCILYMKEKEENTKPNLVVAELMEMEHVSLSLVITTVRFLVVRSGSLLLLLNDRMKKQANKDRTHPVSYGTRNNKMEGTIDQYPPSDRNKNRSHASSSSSSFWSSGTLNLDCLPGIDHFCSSFSFFFIWRLR